MAYLVPVVLALSGLILIFSLSKENKIFIVAGAYFLVLAGWLLADQLMPQMKVFDGGWGIGFRVVTGVVLVVLVVVFIKEYRKKGRDAEKPPAKKSQDKDDGLF